MRLSSRSVVMASAALSLLSVPKALATETRLSTLQSLDGVQDETQVFHFPGLIGEYQLGLVELGRADSTEAYAAAMFKVRGISLGLAVSRDDWLFTNANIGTSVSLFDRFQNVTTDDANSGPLLPTPERPVELIAGFPAGAGTLGLRLAYAGIKNNHEEAPAGAKTTRKQSADHLEVGLGYHTSRRSSFDVAVTVVPTAKQERSEVSGTAETSIQTKVGTSLRFDARWLARKNASGAYAGGRFLTRSHEAKSDVSGQNESGKFSDQLISIQGGYAALTEAAQGFAGIEVASINSKGPTVSGAGGNAVPSYLANDEQAKIDATVLVGAFSGEADVYANFGLMAGMHYILWGSIEEKDDTTDSDIKTERSFAQTADDALWALGIYYQQDAFRVDASYGKDFLYNGPYLLTGNATKPFIGRLSASYSF